jgi:ABC-2 type transport system permease protein
MAGINGAGINGSGIGDKSIDNPEPVLAAGGGLLSPLARAQYGALAYLRWRVFVNGLRSKLGVLELGARTISFAIYALMGIGLGVGVGAAAYMMASRDQWQYFAIVFWVVCVIWQVLPIMLASFGEQFDLGSLLRFPVGFRPFFLLSVVFGLSDLSTIIGGLCCLGVLVGTTAAQPRMFAWTAPILVLFAAFNILLVRAIFAWIDRWLSQRKTREILGAVFMVLVLSMQLTNPAFWQRGHRSQGSGAHQQYRIEQLLASPWVKTANEVQSFLPPGLAAVALRQAAENQVVLALEPLGILSIFVLGAGSVLGLRLRAEYRGENLGAAPARKKAAVNSGKAVAAPPKIAAIEAEGRLGISGPIAAIIEKEIRGLFRSLPLLYAVGAPLVMVLVFSGVFIRGNSARVQAPLLAFPLCVFFAQIGFRMLFSNNLGTEGPGIQLYFLSPTSMRTVLLAKNLLHSAVFAVSMVIAGLLASLRLGQPDGVMVAATVAFLLFVLPVNLAVGNIFSLTMPFRVNPGRISRQRGSQASALFGLLFQAATLGVGAVVFEVCSLGGKLWVAIPAFLILAAIATFVWLRVLGNSDQIASERKDLLIATLMKAE